MEEKDFFKGNATWYLKPHSRAMSGALELETPLLVGEGEILSQFARKKKQWSRACGCCHLSILVQKVYDVILAKQNVFLPNKNIFELWCASLAHWLACSLDLAG